MKQCTKCKQIRPLDRFNNQSWCKTCITSGAREKSREYVAKGLCYTGCGKPLNSGDNTRCVDHAARAKWRLIKKTYGLTEQEYRAKVASQGGKCPITGDNLEIDPPSGTRTNAVVDHCHSTGQVRDILSSRANKILGFLQEDPVLIRKVADAMIAYLEKWAVVKAA